MTMILMLIKKCEFWVQVLFLDLLSVFLVSTVVNELQLTDETAPFKYYSNRKGSQVVEVDRETRCHIFENGHATWIRQTRHGIVNELNYVQFQILLQKCHLTDESRKNGGISDRKLQNVEESGAFTGENDVNNNIMQGALNTSTFLKNIPELQDNALFVNESDVSIFMENNNGDGSNNSSSGSPLIFPGTRWCGRGDIARSIDDIGIYAGTDRCCRDHDQCPQNIVANQCKHDLCNNGSYTRSHCQCDEKFLHCLEDDHSLSSLTSFKIANLYFNILKPTCFAERHPIKSCRRRRLSGDCIQFEYDFQEPITWQFFPAQPFIVRAARNLIESLTSSHNTARPLPTSIPLSFPDPVHTSNQVSERIAQVPALLHRIPFN